MNRWSGALKNYPVDRGRWQDCDEVACPESTIMALAAEDEREALRIGKKMAAMLNKAITVRAADGRVLARLQPPRSSLR